MAGADFVAAAAAIGVIVLPADDRHKVGHEARYVTLEDAGVAMQHVLVHNGDKVALHNDCKYNGDRMEGWGAN